MLDFNDLETQTLMEQYSKIDKDGMVKFGEKEYPFFFNSSYEEDRVTFIQNINSGVLNLTSFGDLDDTYTSFTYHILEDLVDAGIITKEEYEEHKKVPRYDESHQMVSLIGGRLKLYMFTEPFKQGFRVIDGDHSWEECGDSGMLILFENNNTSTLPALKKDIEV